MINRLMSFGPVSDGYELPEDSTFEDAMNIAKPNMPLLIGSTANESNLFLCESSSSMSADAAKSYLLGKLRGAFPYSPATAADVDEVMNEYAGFPNPRAALMALITDMFFTCSAERTARFFSSSGSPVYRYLFVRPSALFNKVKCLGAPHAVDVFMLFAGSFGKTVSPHVIGDALEQEIAKSMIDGWRNFAWHGTPGPQWPRWVNDEATTLQLGNATSADFVPIKGYRSRECSLIDKLIDPLTPTAPSTVMV
jgi:carboxylesterase type B